MTTGAELPGEAAALRQSALHNTVFARVQPEHKRQLVAALGAAAGASAWSATASTTCPRSRSREVAVALGSGSQLAKGVADVVLVERDFEAIPFAIEEGRKILRNVQRVAKLFVAKSVFAAVLILTVGVGGGAYPFLPRQLSLAAAITVGIPAFVLALAPPPPEAAPARVHARRRRVRDPGRHRARRRRPARARPRAHVDRPLGRASRRRRR